MTQETLLEILKDTSAEDYRVYTEERKINKVQNKLMYVLTNKNNISENLEKVGVNLEEVLSEIQRLDAATSKVSYVLSLLANINIFPPKPKTKSFPVFPALNNYIGKNDASMVLYFTLSTIRRRKIEQVSILQEDFIERCNLSLSSLRSSIKLLKDKELIYIEKGDMPDKNYYRVNRDKISEIIGRDILENSWYQLD